MILVLSWEVVMARTLDRLANIRVNHLYDKVHRFSLDVELMELEKRFMLGNCWRVEWIVKPKSCIVFL